MSEHDARPPYAIVVGNEKGETGKSTTAMHLIVALLTCGYRVGSLDLDERQTSLSRYLTNRERYAAAQDISLLMPRHVSVSTASGDGQTLSGEAAKSALDAAFAQMSGVDFVVIDTPGSDSALARQGHLRADTLITPINDSYLDIDVLAKIDVQQREVLEPSVYSRMVWEYHNRRVTDGLAPIDWVVLRNRVAHIDSNNRRDIETLLQLLGKRIGFRVETGFSERVVFRELFPKGLTLLDLDGLTGEARRSRTRLRAYDEIGGLLAAIGLPRDILSARDQTHTTIAAST